MMVRHGILQIRLAMEFTRDRGEIDETIGTQTQEGEAGGSRGIYGLLCVSRRARTRSGIERLALRGYGALEDRG